MRAGPLLGGTVAFILWAPVFGFPGPPVGTENIPQLMPDSTLVCKGEVIEALDVTFSANPQLPLLTASAIARVDRCFKGQPPDGGVVPVLFDNVLPAEAWAEEPCL